MRPMRTTGTRAPQIRIRENDKMSPILFDMFSCSEVSHRLEWFESLHGCMPQNSLRNLRREEGKPALVALMLIVTLGVQSLRNGQWSP
jgi:hypothetical protein